jgi:hypothetical protein
MMFLVTMSCYGARLPGDARGSFDHIRQGERRPLAPNPARVEYHQREMRQDAFLLSSPIAREVVGASIVEVCRLRNWSLGALHVRTTHVHAVVGTAAAPVRILIDWKAYATRALRSSGFVAEDRVVWARGGNIHRLDSPEAVRDAIRYVLDRQGEPLERFCGF